MIVMASNKALPFSPLLPFNSPPSSSPSRARLSISPHLSSPIPTFCRLTPKSHHHSKNFVCKAVEYVFPDPIPEFAEAETEKFRTHLFQRLSKKDDLFGDSVDQVVGVCTEILNSFLHTEYGGPGTLLVVPFIDMADTLNERGLPGAPQAARAAVLWAQKHIDDDWDEWNKGRE